MAPSKEFIEVVKAYKYVSPNLSLFEQLFLNDFWGRITEYYPFWLAPNIITLIGGSCAMASYLILWALSPQGLGSAPSYAYFLAAFLFFTYQTLDGSDGKQARRTGSGSALGEMMDHGVDAVVTGFLGVVAVDALGYGFDSFVPWTCIFGAQMAFFLSNLTLLHRGRQTFFTIDIMELQWAVIVTLIISGAMGSSFWKNQITIPNIHEEVDPWIVYVAKAFSMQASTIKGQGTTFEPRLIIALGSSVGIVSNFFAYIFMASTPYLQSADKRPDHVKRGVPGTGVISLLHQLMVIGLFGFFTILSRNRIQTSDSLNATERLSAYRALIYASSFAIGDIMDRFLIMRVAHVPVPTIPPTIAILAAFTTLVSLLPIDDRLVDYQVWWGFAIIAHVFHTTYFVLNARKLAQALDVHPFKVKDWKKKLEDLKKKTN